MQTFTCQCFSFVFLYLTLETELNVILTQSIRESFMQGERMY